MDYAIRFGASLEKEIGCIDSSTTTDVKRRLFAGVQSEHAVGDALGLPERQAGLLQGEELFAAWRNEAKARGWGPEQAEEVLLHAKAEYQEKLASQEQSRIPFVQWIQNVNPFRQRDDRPEEKEPTRSR